MEFVVSSLPPWRHLWVPTATTDAAAKLQTVHMVEAGDKTTPVVESKEREGILGVYTAG